MSRLGKCAKWLRMVKVTMTNWQCRVVELKAIGLEVVALRAIRIKGELL
jgi:hypothetical protein